MVEPQERNRFSGEIIRHLHTIAARGPVLMTDPRIVAIHGTSRKTIQYLVSNGYIPGYQHSRHPYLEIGDISIFPTSQFLQSRFVNVLSPNFVPEVYERLQKDPDKSRSVAINYAKLISNEHELWDTLTEGESMQTRTHDSQRNGFLLGFSVDVLKHPGIELVPGDDDEADLTIRPGRHGLPYTMIASIEPLGDDERIYLRSLKV